MPASACFGRAVAPTGISAIGVIGSGIRVVATAAPSVSAAPTISTTPAISTAAAMCQSWAGDELKARVDVKRKRDQARQ
jgi:hypothetical protein